MFVTIIMWFASYNMVMTGDKFMYIFGRMAPSITLVLTMVMRFVPSFRKKAIQIAAARKSVGKAGDSGSGRDKVENGMIIVSALTNWALEGGIITADSMQSRGYGCGQRTAFSIYRFAFRDVVLLSVMLLLMAAIIFCGLNGGAATTYTPEINIAGFDNLYSLIGIVCYFVFLAIPTALNIGEEITWRILRSRI